MAGIIDKQLSRLQSILLLSNLQKTNQPLFQILTQLISSLRTLQDEIDQFVTEQINNIPDVHNLQIATVADESAGLPNSRELLAGTNISFDVSIANELTINAIIASLSQIFLTGANEVATLPNSRQLLAGTNITFDDTVPNERTVNASGSSGGTWSVLTNGDATYPELIFAGGDVIMVFTP